MCCIACPPPQVSMIHQEIIRKLEERFQSQGLNLIRGDSGPAVVVVVNNSRLVMDVKRDLATAGRVFIYALFNASHIITDVSSARVLLLIIKPTRKMEERTYLQMDDLEDTRIKEVCFILVDPSFSKVHTCKFNNDSFDTANGFLQKMNNLI